MAHALNHLFLLIFATAVGAIAVDCGYARWDSMDSDRPGILIRRQLMELLTRQGEAEVHG